MIIDMNNLQTIKEVEDSIITESSKNTINNNLQTTINDSLTVKELEDSVIIESSKNIIFRSNSNIIIQSDGYNIIMGKELHFNPKIDKDITNINKMIEDIDKSKRIQILEHAHYHNKFTCIFKKLKIFLKKVCNK